MCQRLLSIYESECRGNWDLCCKFVIIITNQHKDYRRIETSHLLLRLLSINSSQSPQDRTSSKSRGEKLLGSQRGWQNRLAHEPVAKLVAGTAVSVVTRLNQSD